MDFNKELEEIKTKMTPMNTIKFIGGTLISLGAAAAMFAMMKTGLMGSKGVTKLIMKLGIFTLACKAGDIAKNYFEENFEDMVTDAQKVFNENKEDA